MTEDEKDAAAAMIKLHGNVEELINGAVNKAFAQVGINSSYSVASPSYAYILKSLFDKHQALDDLRRAQINNLEAEIRFMKTELNMKSVGGR